MSEKAVAHGGIPYAQGTPFVQQAMSIDVLTAARLRLHEVAISHDTMLVSVSGGKDSDIIRHLALEAAQAAGKPLHIIYCDEEIIDPDTLAHLDRLRAETARYQNVFFHWLCVPLRHSLRSDVRPIWWPWDEDLAAIWHRPMPAFAEHPDNLSKAATKGNLRFDGVMATLFPPSQYGHVVQISGVRTHESINRYRDVINAGGFLTQRGPHSYAKPIYDWKTRDVWAAIGMFGLDYSKLYDRMAQYGISLEDQRVSVWGNSAASRETKMWAELFPDEWARALLRLPELADQARYGGTYAYRKGTRKPPGLTWHDWAIRLIEAIPDPERQDFWMDEVAGAMRRWSRVYSVPFPEKGIPGTQGQSWKNLAYRISKNDVLPRERGA